MGQLGTSSGNPAFFKSSISQRLFRRSSHSFLHYPCPSARFIVHTHGHDGDELGGVPGATHGSVHPERLHPQSLGLVEVKAALRGQLDEAEIHVTAAGEQVAAGAVQDALREIGPESLAFEEKITCARKDFGASCGKRRPIFCHGPMPAHGDQMQRAPSLSIRTRALRSSRGEDAA